MGHHPYEIRFCPVSDLQGLICPGILHRRRAGTRQRRQKLGIPLDELVGTIAVHAENPLGPVPDEQWDTEERGDPLGLCCFRVKKPVFLGGVANDGWLACSKGFGGVLQLVHVDRACVQVPIVETEGCDGVDKNPALAYEHDRAGADLHSLGRTLGDEIEHLIQI